jgi:hypothetical protein
VSLRPRLRQPRPTHTPACSYTSMASAGTTAQRSHTTNTRPSASPMAVTLHGGTAGSPTSAVSHIIHDADGFKKGAKPSGGKALLGASRGKAAVPWTSLASRLWELSWPLSGMEVLTFAKELIITSFVGHLGAFELSALVLSQTLVGA